MSNWRRPILDLYDAHVADNPVPGHISLLNKYHGWPAEQRRQAQAERLSRLLLHAARGVPYYRDLLARAGAVRGDRVDLSRFQNVPALTRENLRTEFERLKSVDLETRAWYVNHSGGSSGEPVMLLQDREYEAIGLAATEMHYGWAGREPGEPFVRLWGSDRDLLLGTVGWRNKLSNFIRGMTFLNSFNMTAADMERYVRIIQQIRPVMIEAYAESAFELAGHIVSENARLSGIRSVITGAGTLYPFMRTRIEQAFRCPVLNRYGAREVGPIAAERVAGAGLDVFTYAILIEVVDEAKRPCRPGEEGDVLVTCLTNYTMPVIRYQIGDRAVVGAVSMSPTPSVERLLMVTGRRTDTFVRDDGSTVPAAFFIHFIGVVHNSGWLKKTQIIQQDYHSVLIKIVVKDSPPARALDEIRGSLQRVLGSACRVEFEFVDDIPPLPSGKYRYTISHVARP